MKRNPPEMYLSQPKYISDLLQKAAMHDIFDLLQKASMHEARPLSTPMASTAQLTSSQESPFNDAHLYRYIVGGLQYATVTHLDLSLSVNKACQYMHAPLNTHWKAVKRIL